MNEPIKVPMYEAPKAIDFCPFMAELGKKYGFDYRDMAGCRSGNPEAEYQDVWHWLLANPFDDLRRGGFNYLEEDWLEEDIPDYVRKCLEYIFIEAKKTDAYDKEEKVVCFHIDW